jgi:hypothetical protein
MPVVELTLMFDDREQIPDHLLPGSADDRLGSFPARSDCSGRVRSKVDGRRKLDWCVDLGRLRGGRRVLKALRT